MNEYLHRRQMPDQLIDYLIDLKCEIDMGNHDEETTKELKVLHNKLVGPCTDIRTYKL